MAWNMNDVANLETFNETKCDNNQQQYPFDSSIHIRTQPFELSQKI